VGAWLAEFRETLAFRVVRQAADAFVLLLLLLLYYSQA